MYAISLTEVRKNDPVFSSSVVAVEQYLGRLPFNGLLRQLGDTRNLHETLFRRFQPHEYKDACGNYRGTEGTTVEKWNIGRDPSAPAAFSSAYQDVAHDIESLAETIQRMDMSDAPDRYFRKSVFIFQRFQTIHPYYDGNGHIDRLIIKSLMRRHKDIYEYTDFPISPHPFTTGLQICIENYKHHPELLQSYFLNWFRY